MPDLEDQEGLEQRPAMREAGNVPSRPRRVGLRLSNLPSAFDSPGTSPLPTLSRYTASPVPYPSPTFTLHGLRSNDALIQRVDEPSDYFSLRGSPLADSARVPGEIPNIKIVDQKTEAPTDCRTANQIPEAKEISPTTDQTVLQKISIPAKPKWLGRVCDEVGQHISLKSIWEILDPTDYLWPPTVKKYLVLLAVSALVASLIVSNHYTLWIEKSMAVTRSYMLPVLVLVIAFEPIVFLIIMTMASLPPLKNKSIEDPTAAESGDGVPCPVKPREVALIVPCHNSDMPAVGRLLQSAFQHFLAQDIFIIDNGRTRHPKSSAFRDYVRAQHPDINYIWSPIGSKGVAQYVGALAAKHYRYIMAIDDDVCLPSTYRHPTHLMDKRTGAVCFPIKAIGPHGDVSLFMVGWQDCEYRMSGLAKVAEDRFGCVLFPHGPAWFARRETVIDIFTKHHSLDFIAEDCRIGFCLMKMKKRLRFDATVLIETEAPTTIIGPGLNWVKQRVKSWEMGRHGMLLRLVLHLFQLNAPRTVAGVFWEKLSIIYAIASILIDWVRIPVFVTMGTNAMYWEEALLLSLASVVPLLVYRFIVCRHRPDMKVRVLASLTYPIYKLLYSFVCILGGVRCVLFYLGGHKKPKKMQQLLEEKDEAAFWLDPRFGENPGWLADEGEILRGQKREENYEAHSSVAEDLAKVPEDASLPTHRRPSKALASV